MSEYNEDSDTGSTRRQNSRGNNQAHLSGEDQGPKTLFSHLTKNEKEKLLRDAGFFYGFSVNGKGGPRQSTRPVVKLKDDAQLPNSIREYNNMITEVVPTKTDRDANFAHHGWSASAISTATPWIASRIAKNNQAPGENLWVTKRMVVQRLVVTLALQDLVPAPEFEQDVLAALGKASSPEKFQELDQVFQLWGDVIPLEFDLGSSLSITDLEKNFDQASDPDDPNELQNMTAFRTRRINTQGGEANLLPSGDAKAWIARAVPSNLWSQVRVVQVTPITSLLKPETKEKLVNLYSTLLSYRPPLLDGVTSDGKIFDGGSHALKTISSLVVHSNTANIMGVSVSYADGTGSGQYGNCGGQEPTFILNNGEHIAEVIVWADVSWVYGLQFTTSDGRISPHYGSTAGTPTIASSEDGVLAAFYGIIRSGLLQRLQTIWRHDIVKTRSSQKGKYFEYVGNSTGNPFNDWPYLRSSKSAYISSVKIKTSDHILSIQITYADNNAGEVIYTEGPMRGGPGGTENLFTLEPGEHIVGIQGRLSARIDQLFFTTNFGRTSSIYGGNAGNPFKCQPPRGRNNTAMRLSYIAGKSGHLLDGVLFVWAPM